MRIARNIKLMYLSLIVAGVSSCSDKWDDHLSNSDERTKNSIVQQISQESDLSEFTKLLIKSGLDKEIAQGNSFTVFAPANAALSNLSANIVNNQDSLRNFLQNHIAVSIHRFSAQQDTVSITMMNGKILDMVGNEIGEVAFNKSNLGSGNGVYHILSQSLVPKDNLWEYIKKNANYSQNQFIEHLNAYDLFNQKSDQETDEFENNEFLKEIADVRREDRRFTYVLYANTAFEQFTEDFKTYVNYYDQADSTLKLSKFFTVKDLVFTGAYSKEDLPEVLVSRGGVEVQIDKSKIVNSISLSNGYVHIVNTPIVSIASKLLDIRIEGENVNSISESGLRDKYFFRTKKDPNGEIFNDFMVRDHGKSALEVGYTLPRMYTTTYKVYWRAINDIQTNVFQQKLRIGGVWIDGVLLGTIKDLGYKNVEVSDYNEIELGEVTIDDFSRIRAYLVASATTNNGQNTLTLDYLRFEPQIK